MKAAIIIEKWKLPTFSRHLRAAKLSYDTAEGIVHNTITLTVDCENSMQVQLVCVAAMDECRKKGAPK